MLRVAIIGLGMAVEPHARSLLDLAGRVDVRWAAARSDRSAEAFAAKFPFPTTTDVRAAIADPDVDAILLLTPADTHLELARLAFSHGKHVLVEKPLDARLDRAAAVVAEARAAGLTLGVVLQQRFRPSARRLQGILETAALGDVQFASASIRWWRPQSYYDQPGRGTLTRDGGGVLMTQAIHTLDLMRALLGPLSVTASQACTTRLHQMEGEDYVAALLTLASGAPATFMATTAQFPGLPEQIEVVGTLGTATLAGAALNVRYLDGTDEQVLDEGATGAGADFMAFPHHAHRALIEDFAEAVLTGRAPRASADEALATQKLINDVLRRAAGHPVAQSPGENGNTSRHLDEIR